MSQFIGNNSGNSGGMGGYNEFGYYHDQQAQYQQAQQQHHYDSLSNKRSLEQQDIIVEQSMAKKQKNYTPEASRVVHLRNLPLDCTEYDIHHIAIPFGPIQHIAMIKGKGQALVQMANIASAESFVQYYTTVQGKIGTKSFYIQFSNRDEISKSIESPNDILLVTITDITYIPVTIEVLYKLFSNYGTVLKILIFTKSGHFQSLIQMGSVEMASVAKQALDGGQMYTGCCNLKIQFSSLDALKIRYNNDKSRDFTNPNSPLQPPPPILSNTPHSILYPIGLIPAPHPVSLPNPNQESTPNSGSVLIVAGLPEQGVTPDDLFTLFGVYGDPIRVKIMFNKKDTALVQLSSSQQCDLILQYFHSFPFRGHTVRVNLSKHSSISLPKPGDTNCELTKDYMGSSMHRFKLPGSKNYQNIHPPSTTLHVSNLPLSSPTESENTLKSLFSHYGHLKSFKFFPNDNKMALIEMSTLEESINALVGLHGYSIVENLIKVSFAKPTIIKKSILQYSTTNISNDFQNSPINSFSSVKK